MMRRQQALAAIAACISLLYIMPAMGVEALASTSIIQAQPGSTEYSCEAVQEIPAPERCAFVRTQCEADSRLPYTRWYYCKVAPHGWWAKGMFVLLLLALLPLLFTALGDTAELYFSPTMALIAQTIPGMRPRFAGVTFVAVGNGAPDLSANITALRTGQVALSAGAFTGAAMFVQCVVASEVIRISGGVKCRGATVRDVGVYAASVAGVCLALHSGKVTQWFVAGTTMTYLAYVAWVFLGDEWHARGRPELRPGLGMSWSDLRALLLRRQHLQLQRQRLPTSRTSATHTAAFMPAAALAEQDSMSQALLPWAAVDEHGSGGVGGAAGVPAAAAVAGGGTGPVRGGATQPGARAQAPDMLEGLDASAGSGFLGSHAYRQAVWADLGWEPSGKARRQLAVELRAGSPEMGLRSSSPSASDEEDEGLLQTDHSHSHWADGQQGSGMHAPAGPDGMHTGQQLRGPRHSSEMAAGQHQHGREVQGREEADTGPSTWKQKLWHVVCAELSLGSSAEWGQLPGWRLRIRRTSFATLLPLYAALRLSIPQVDPETYSQRWLVASMLCSPLAVVAYFEAFSWWSVGCALLVGGCAALCVHVLTRDEPEMPRLDCGTRFAFGPALVSLVGFFMGVLWIDSLASEVVGVVTLLSGLLGLPPSLVGLTLLAWGNSLGDFFGNQAMARRGASSTAFTACFAAPLFNMLLSMALGFSAYFAKEHTSSAPVSLPADAALGAAALVIYNIILAAVGLLNKNHLPARFYLFARAWYAVYLVAAGVLAMTAGSGGI